MTVPDMRRFRVLLVEDDAMSGTVRVEVLGSLGYDVCPVGTTEARTVSATALLRPDVMIMDLQSAEGSGRSAMTCIGKTNPVPHPFRSGDLFQAAVPGSVVLRKPFRESRSRAGDRVSIGENVNTRLKPWLQSHWNSRKKLA